MPVTFADHSLTHASSVTPSSLRAFSFPFVFFPIQIFFPSSFRENECLLIHRSGLNGGTVCVAAGHSIWLSLTTYSGISVDLWAVKSGNSDPLSVCFAQWPVMCISGSAGNVMALCVLYSSSRSGDLPNTSSFTYSSTAWMNVLMSLLSFFVHSAFYGNDEFPLLCYFHKSLCFSFHKTSQSLSLFLRRLKSFADRHSQLCSSLSIQNPSTFLAKSFIFGRTESSEEEEEVDDEEKSGFKGGDRREVPLCKDSGTVWGRRVCSSPAPNWYRRERVDRGGWRVGERRDRGDRRRMSNVDDEESTSVSFTSLIIDPWLLPTMNPSALSEVRSKLYSLSLCSWFMLPELKYDTSTRISACLSSSIQSSSILSSRLLPTSVWCSSFITAALIPSWGSSLFSLLTLPLLALSFDPPLLLPLAVALLPSLLFLSVTTMPVLPSLSPLIPFVPLRCWPPSGPPSVLLPLAFADCGKGE